MIITLTPNPSVDRIVTLERIRFNETLRTENARIEWGGKGFNVSRGLSILGEESLALGWMGGWSGRMMDAGLRDLGTPTDFVWVEDETRTNTLVFEAEGEWYVRLVEAGPYIPESAIEGIYQKVDSHTIAGDILLACGSLPKGVPENFYGQLIRHLKHREIRVCVDSNGQALRHALAEKPFLLSPEVLDAEAIVGYPIKTNDDAKRAVVAFLRQGVQHVAIAPSSQSVILGIQRELVMATAPKMATRNANFASDALLAGLVYGFAKNLEFEQIARWGVGFMTVASNKATLSEVKLADVEAMLPRLESRVIANL